MSEQRPAERGSPPELTEQIRDRILADTRGLADRALERLRGLGAALPAGAADQVRRIRDDPGRERRKSPRLCDPPLTVTVHTADPAAPDSAAPLRDHSPTGLAVVLPCPAGEGTVLHLRSPQGQWVAVVVRHCRREGGGWVAGCELLDGQPPI